MSQRLAYLGPQGTFSEQAGILYDASAELVPCNSHSEVILALLKEKADKGIVARENSIGGSVADGVDPLVSYPVGIRLVWNGRELTAEREKLMLCGEVQLPIVQCLYTKPETRVREVQAVFSHPQGLAQCQRNIARRFPRAVLVSTLSTVAALPEMLNSKVPAVAIAPPGAGKLYPDACRVAESFEDNHSNTTRFVVVGRHDEPPTLADKTSFWFTVPEDEKPGSFDKVSQIFASCGINKRLVESRPTKTELGRYIFLIDIDGHRQDEVIRRALELIAVAGLTTTLKVLGSYPRWENGA